MFIHISDYSAVSYDRQHFAYLDDLFKQTDNCFEHSPTVLTFRQTTWKGNLLISLFAPGCKTKSLTSQLFGRTSAPTVNPDTAHHVHVAQTGHHVTLVHASQHVLRMSFVPEQEAQNVDRQVLTF